MLSPILYIQRVKEKREETIDLSIMQSQKVRNENPKFCIFSQAKYITGKLIPQAQYNLNFLNFQNILGVVFWSDSKML